MLLRARSPAAQVATTTVQHIRVTCPVLSVLPATHPGSRAAARKAPKVHDNSSAATSFLARKRPVSSSYSTTCEQCGTYTDYSGFGADDGSEEEECEDSSDDEEGDRYEVHHVHTRLPLRAAALGDDGAYVLSYDNGGTAWSLVPDSEAHRELQSTMKYKKQITAIALGRNQGSVTYYKPDNPGDVYFLMRNTGTSYMGGGCEATLREHWWDGQGDERVVKVSFAPSNGWYLFKQGGGGSWSGLPDSLHAYLNKWWDTHGPVRALSVGHNGEWWVMFNAGGCGWCGVHPTLEKLLSSKAGSRLRDRTGDVQWVELGPDGTFIALFEHYTAWYGSEDLTDALLAAMIMKEQRKSSWWKQSSCCSSMHPFLLAASGGCLVLCCNSHMQQCLLQELRRVASASSTGSAAVNRYVCTAMISGVSAHTVTEGALATRGARLSSATNSGAVQDD